MDSLFDHTILPAQGAEDMQFILSNFTSIVVIAGLLFLVLLVFEKMALLFLSVLGIALISFTLDTSKGSLPVFNFLLFVIFGTLIIKSVTDILRDMAEKHKKQITFKNFEVFGNSYTQVTIKNRKNGPSSYIIPTYFLVSKKMMFFITNLEDYFQARVHLLQGKLHFMPPTPDEFMSFKMHTDASHLLVQFSGEDYLKILDAYHEQE